MPHSRFIILSATLNDVVACLRFEAIDQDFRKTTFDSKLMTAAISTDWVYIAEHHGKIVGFMRVDFVWPMKEPLLVWMASNPDHLHQGINAALFEAITSQLRKHGFKRLITSACRQKHY